MSGKMEFDFQLKRHDTSSLKQEDHCSLLVLADFGAPRNDAAAAPMRRVDVDTLDTLWERFEPRLVFEVAGQSIDFAPRDIDDFHPDALYRDLPVFGELRSLRKRLMDPQTADETLAQLMQPGAPPGTEGQQAADPSNDRSGNATADDSNDMFSRLLGQSQRHPDAPAAQVESQVDRLIRDVIAPHIVHDPDPRVDAAIDSVDRGISDLMGQVLHHPEFQSLEGNWRALTDLVQGVETDENLQIRVCSLDREALLNALPSSSAELAGSALFGLLVERFRIAADDRTPDVIAVGFDFGPHPDDVALLASLGAIADAINAVVLAAAQAGAIGASQLAEQPEAAEWNNGAEANPLWLQLRKAPFANRLGLALPRLLGRLPYGAATDPVSAFDYEEMPEPLHSNFLWMNPAMPLARLVAERFTRVGWTDYPDGPQDIGELPAYSYAQDGESKMQPCAELLLPERSAEAILEKGIMPIVSFRNRDTARLLRFQSIALPLQALSGPWSD